MIGYLTMMTKAVLQVLSSRPAYDSTLELKSLDSYVI